MMVRALTSDSVRERAAASLLPLVAGSVSAFQRIAFTLGLWGWVLASLTVADGGRVELSQQLGDTRVTVFSSPTPCRVGTVEISVLMQQAGGTVLRNQKVIISCVHQESGLPMTRLATHEQSTNQLLHCATFDLPESGRWDITVQAGANKSSTVQFVLYAAPPLLIPSGLWVITLAPVGFIALYLLRERIRR